MSAKRIAVVSVVAGVLVGAAIASGVAQASGGGRGNNPASGSAASVATAAVVRTNLSSTVQIGGSIGYQGSYAVAAPTGATAQQVAQAQQAVTQSQLALAADQTAATDATTSDQQAELAAQAAATSAAATLSADQSQEKRDCAGRGAATPACSQDTQKVSQDQTQEKQLAQALTTARLSAMRDHDQNQIKVQIDTAQLQAAQANLAGLDATAVNPGTTYTALPKVGQIVRQGEPVYSVNGRPVPLLYGTVSAYRAFEAGMADGADVGELTDDLIALGYGAGLVRGDHFSVATVAAIDRWQTALGLPATGTVLVGEVVFEPGPMRVTTVTPSVGQAVAPGSVLDATSTTPIVTVALQVTQEYLVKPGDSVVVVLPDGTTTVGGRVETVGDVATCPNGNGSGAGNGSPGNGPADASPCSSSGSGQSSTPTVTVTITLDGTPPGATLDQAPVNVNITTQRADGVLAVPVNALLALQGGGDAVEVVKGSSHQLVGVTTGLYSSTMVEISGAGITAGTRVEVPSS